MNTDQKKCAILLYTNGSKPFVRNFYSAHKEQSIRLEIDYICISLKLWPGSEPAVELQNERRSTVPYTGILEAILQGLEKLDDDTIVFIAEDDCLYRDARYCQQYIDLARSEPDYIFYQTNVSFVAGFGFYIPKINGICLHSAFGTAGAMHHNIKHKLAEFNGETEFPISSVEPVSYPTAENPEPAHAIYRTRCINSTIPLSLDFRGYGGQTWKPDGDEETFQTHHVWGQASELWQLMIGTDQSDA
jgi:hypothetical protein